MNPSRHFAGYVTGFPADVTAFTAIGGFSGLKNALGMSPEEVIERVKDAHLRGRGGAGFDTGFKWSTVPRDQPSYVVCNADEGEPGTFKDRYLLSGAPYLVLEGMLIAAYAVGAEQGYIYVRGEYPSIIDSLVDELDSMRANGFLGDKILGTDFSFDIEVMPGAGSYVVGDETALLSSLMGRRG